jgi:hypothetical protein
MSEETSDKSPRSPTYPLADAVEDARKLLGAIGRATVKPESAAVALGYKGLNGAALTTLGTLSQYGLIERSKGTVVVTPLALRILHPTGEDQRKAALREAALSPKVFKELVENFADCTAEVLTSHLVQNGFNVDRAKRAAGVFVANKGFTDLSGGSSVERHGTHDERSSDTEKRDKGENINQPATGGALRGTRRVLTNYTIPVGANEATIKVEGERLSVQDFDEIIDFLTFCKKQFQRRSEMWDKVAPAAKDEEGP